MIWSKRGCARVNVCQACECETTISVMVYYAQPGVHVKQSLKKNTLALVIFDKSQKEKD
jgi:hypothetical protein